MDYLTLWSLEPIPIISIPTQSKSICLMNGLFDPSSYHILHCTLPKIRFNLPTTYIHTYLICIITYTIESVYDVMSLCKATLGKYK